MELQRHNVSLETENKSLKDQVEFLRTLLKNNSGHGKPGDQIDQYFTIDPSTEPSSREMVSEQEEESSF